MINQQFYQMGNAPSVIRQLFAYGLQQAAKVGKENVFDYSIGNPSIPAPKKVGDTVKKLIDEMDSIQLHGYSMAAGFDSARAAVAADLSKRFGLDVKGSELFFTCGAAPALISVIKALTVSPDTEILAIAPFFPEYRPFVTSNGAKLVVVPADTEAFQIKLDAVEKCISANTQAVIINSPNNPSGVVFDEENLKGLAGVLRRHEEKTGKTVFLISDEPYRELVYDGISVPCALTLYDDAVMCYSFSKSLPIPGERLGYIAVSDRMACGKDLYASILGAGRCLGYVNPPSLFQRVVERCLGQTSDVSQYQQNRDLLCNGLRELGYEFIKPSGAFYLFVKSPEPDAVAFSERAKKHELLLVPSDDFGCTGYVRIAYCVSADQIRRSMPAFKALMDEYRK